MIRVWVDFESLGCCGGALHVGDRVEWRLDEATADSVPHFAPPVTHRQLHHVELVYADDSIPTVSGSVARIAAVLRGDSRSPTSSSQVELAGVGEELPYRPGVAGYVVDLDATHFEWPEWQNWLAERGL